MSVYQSGQHKFVPSCQLPFIKTRTSNGKTFTELNENKLDFGECTPRHSAQKKMQKQKMRCDLKQNTSCWTRNGARNEFAGTKKNSSISFETVLSHSQNRPVHENRARSIQQSQRFLIRLQKVDSKTPCHANEKNVRVEFFNANAETSELAENLHFSLSSSIATHINRNSWIKLNVSKMFRFASHEKKINQIQMSVGAV